MDKDRNHPSNGPSARLAEELRSSSGVLQRIFDVLPLGLWFADKDGVLLRGNPAGVRIWGAEPHVSPKDYGLFKARWLPSGEEVKAQDWSLLRTLSQGESVTDELLEIEAFDGVKRVILNSTVPVFDDDGNIQGAIIINKDINERYHAEEALREREELLNEVGRIAKIGGWEFDLATGEATWTQAIYQILEIEPGQPIPRIHEHIHYYLPEYRPTIVEALRVLIEQDKPFDFEAPFRTPTGKIKWARALGHSVWREGKCVKAFGTFQDITERKETTKALLEAALREQEVARAGQIGLWDWDLATNKVIYSAEWKHQIGYEDHEIGNDFQEWESRVHPDDLGPVRGQIEKMLAESKDHRYQVEFRFRHKDGSYRHILAQASIIRDETGRAIRTLGSHVDLTERKQAEAALRISEERHRTFLNSTTDMAFIKDHQFRYELVNEANARFFGRPMEEILGHDDFDLMPPDAAAKCRESDQAALYQGVVTGIEKVGDCYYEARKFPIPLQEGRTGVGGFVRDVTEYEQAKEKMNAQLEELRRWHEATLGRELRVIELKREVNALLAAAGQPPRYPSVENDP